MADVWALAALAFFSAARSLPAKAHRAPCALTFGIVRQPYVHDLDRAILADQYGLWNQRRLIVVATVPALSSAILAVTPFCSAKRFTSAGVSSRFTAYSTTPLFLNSAATFSICGMAECAAAPGGPEIENHDVLPFQRRQIELAAAEQIDIDRRRNCAQQWMRWLFLIGRIVDLDQPLRRTKGKRIRGQDRVLLPIPVRRDASHADVRRRGLSHFRRLLRQSLVQIGSKLPQERLLAGVDPQFKLRLAADRP